MVATVTASIGSLILTLDDPARDDLDSVIVWASTTNGFTPGPSNKVFQGKSLTIVVANLAPLVLHYLRYAYVSSIEPDNYEISAQLTGTPNQIDGSLVASGALRGKLLAGGVITDAGNLTTAAVAAPSSEIATTTLSLIDTVDFQSTGGGGVLYSPDNLSPIYFRYTGKTATTLTGVSGFKVAIKSGALVMPMTGPSAVLTSYAGGGSFSVGKFNFRQAGGNALAISAGAVSQAITYTAGQTFTVNYSPSLAGVAGLASFTTADPIRVIVDNPGFPTSVVGAPASYSTLTLGAATAFLNPNGGIALLVSPGVVGIKTVTYSAYAGTTLTLSPSTFLAAGTYTIIPVASQVAAGLGQSPLIMWTNTQNGLWINTSIGSTVFGVQTSQLRNMTLEGVSAPALVLKRATESPTPLPVASFENPGRNLHAIFGPTMRSSLAAAFDGEFGVVDFNNDGSLLALALNSIAGGVQYYQTISTTVRFNTWDQPADAIAFDDALDVFSFNADGGTANASLAAAGATFGTSASFTVAGAFLNGGAFIQDPTIAGTLYGSQVELKPGGTNLANQTEDLSAAAWTKANVTVTANTAAGPDGLVTLDTITDDAASANHRVINNVAATYAGTSAIASAFFRAGTASRAFLAIREGAAIVAARHAHFDLSAGVVLSKGNQVQDAGLIPLGGGLFRAWVRVNVAAGANASGIAAGFTQPGTTATLSYSGSGQTLIMGGFQLEEGTGLPSAYTPATTAPVATPRAPGVDGATALELRVAGNVVARLDAGRFTTIGATASPGTRSTVASGSTINAAANDNSILYDQAATVAALTIVLPTTPVDGQDFTISTRSAITALTITGTAYGKPTTLAAGGFCSFKYSTAGAAWFRVG